MTVLPAVAAAAANPSLRRQLSVVVASQNAVKINAVAAALRQALPGVEHRIEGSSSQSGVPDQPWGDEQTLRGALNRVQSIRSHPSAAGSLLVAIEGGVGYAAPLPAAGSSSAEQQQQQQQQQQQGQPPASPWAQQWQHARQRHWALQPPAAPGAPHPPQQGGALPELECYAWVVVQSPCGAVSHARSASFPLPPAVNRLMLQEGLELGEADDRVFGRVRSGQGSGTIGQLTGGLVMRQAYYEHATLMALVPLMNPALYPGFDLSLLPALDGLPPSAAEAAAAAAGAE